MDQRPVRIANFSGAMGDKFTAFAEAVTGEPVDVVIGDSMAEITMSMVSAGFRARPEAQREFYSEHFLRQLTPQLGEIAARGIKVVTNAGVYDPAGLAAAIRAEIADRGLDLRVAHVTGDDLLARSGALVADGQLARLDTGEPLAVPAAELIAANAYLGGWGIRTALDEGTDIVVAGRVADASLVTGPAAWWHGWGREQYDEIAGATAAAHIIECGPQATGGNFSGFTRLDAGAEPGFPIAEVAADGGSVITKRAADEGAVTIDTVTAQFMYEIQGPRYLNPDVTWHTDSVRVRQDGPDRVRISGARGSAPSDTTKVGINFQRGHRGAIWLFPTGLDVDAKLEVFRAQADRAAQDHPVDEVHFFPCGRPVDDPADQWQATMPVQLVVAAETAAAVTGFLNQFTSYGLGGIPGFYVDLTSAFSLQPVPRIDYWPGLVRQRDLDHRVVLDDGREIAIAPPRTAEFTGQPQDSSAEDSEADFGATARRPLGEVAHARTGDKGADANLGVWVPDEAAWPWLRSYLTAAELARLLGLPAHVRVERYEQPNLRGISFVLRDHFAPSGSANLALDQIGKSLGEFLRARHVDIPVHLLDRDRTTT